MYHRVRPRLPDRRYYPNMHNTVYADDFAKHVEWLSKTRRLLQKEEFLRCIEGVVRFPEQAVLITFDDGQTDFLRYAFPALKKNSVPAVVFLPVSFVGTNKVFWWDELEHYMLHSRKTEYDISGIRVKKYKEYKVFHKIAADIKKRSDEEKAGLLCRIRESLCPDCAFPERSVMDWDQVKELSSESISFEAHTNNHKLLSSLSGKESEQEIAGSKAGLEQMTGHKVSLMAYPYGYKGSFYESHEIMARDSGYKAAFSTYDGLVSDGAGRFALPRIGIDSTDDLFMLGIKMSGMPRIIKRAIRKVRNTLVKLYA